MDGSSNTRGSRLEDAADINQAIAADIRERRTEAGVTLETLAVHVGEQKAAINKHENGTNQIHVAKYLSIISFLRDFCPDHPAHRLVAALGGFHQIGAMLHEDRPQARLAGFLDVVDRTRKACPDHPALPLADYLLYRRG